MTRTIGTAIGVVTTALLAAGCATYTHGELGARSRAHFEGQRVSHAPAADTPDGLDPEEAAIIQRSYRESIGAEDSATQQPEPTILIVEDPK